MRHASCDGPAASLATPPWDDGGEEGSMRDGHHATGLAQGTLACPVGAAAGACGAAVGSQGRRMRNAAGHRARRAS